VLVGRLTDGAGDGALGDGALGDEAADGDGLIEGEGAGPQATSRAQSRAAASGFIVR
jgi:hypothetical protein